jgi:hypothetical protein
LGPGSRIPGPVRQSRIDASRARVVRVSSEASRPALAGTGVAGSGRNTSGVGFDDGVGETTTEGVGLTSSLGEGADVGGARDGDDCGATVALGDPGTRVTRSLPA